MPPKKSSKRNKFAKGHKLRHPTPKKGVPSYDAEELATRKIDKGMISRSITVNSHLTREQLKKRIETEPISILERAVINSLLRVASTGDFYMLDTVLDRMIGKVPNKIEHSKPDPFEGKTMEELLKMKEELTESNRQTLKLLEQTPRVQQQEREVIDIITRAKSGTGSSDN